MIKEMRPGSYLESIGARAGDVVRKINEKVIVTVEDFEKAVSKYRFKSSAVLVIQREKQQYYVTVKLET